MLKMVQFTIFKQVNSLFLNKLKGDTKHIKQKTKLYIAADKTTNFSKVEPSADNDLLEQNITKSYKKRIPMPYESSMQKTKKSQRNLVSMTE